MFGLVQGLISFMDQTFFAILSQVVGGHSETDGDADLRLDWPSSVMSRE